MRVCFTVLALLLFTSVASGEGPDPNELNRSGVEQLLLDTPESLKKAKALFREAAMMGHVVAQCNLGDMYRNGKTRSRGWTEKQQKANQQKKILRWYNLAAQGGSAEAKFQLAQLYQSGEFGIEVDLQQSERLYEEAFRHRHNAAGLSLGQLLENRGAAQDAQDIYTILWKEGVLEAGLRLANLLSQMPNPDVHNIHNIYTQIMDSNRASPDLISAAAFANANFYSRKGNLDLALYYYVLAAENGDVRGHLQAAKICLRKGGELGRKKAMDQYEAAMKLESAEAYYRYYRLAMENAQRKLASRKQMRSYRVYLEIAEKMGYPDAVFETIVLEEESLGYLKKNFQKIKNLADQGHERACCYLASAYKTGSYDGVLVSNIEAAYYFILGNGFEDFDELLAHMLEQRRLDFLHKLILHFKKYWKGDIESKIRNALQNTRFAYLWEQRSSAIEVLLNIPRQAPNIDPSASFPRPPPPIIADPSEAPPPPYDASVDGPNLINAQTGMLASLIVTLGLATKH